MQYGLAAWGLREESLESQLRITSGLGLNLLEFSIANYEKDALQIGATPEQIREVKEIPLFAGKAKLKSNHPEGRPGARGTETGSSLRGNPRRSDRSGERSTSSLPQRHDTDGSLEGDSGNRSILYLRSGESCRGRELCAVRILPRVPRKNRVSASEGLPGHGRRSPSRRVRRGTAGLELPAEHAERLLRSRDDRI